MMEQTRSIIAEQPKQPQGCDCIRNTNEWLQEEHPGVYLAEMTHLPTDTKKIIPQVERRGCDPSTPAKLQRKRLPSLVVTFCPFCGKRYVKDTPVQMPAPATGGQSE